MKIFLSFSYQNTQQLPPLRQVSDLIPFNPSFIA
jgi:hypothetical protein